jgi:hypothetical protein
MRGDRAHLAGLNLATELLPQFVSPGLDHRVMRDSHDRSLGPVEGHGDLRRLPQELIEFFLQSGRRPIHGWTPSRLRISPPRRPKAALYHRMPAFSY